MPEQRSRRGVRHRFNRIAAPVVELQPVDIRQPRVRTLRAVAVVAEKP